MNTCEACGPRVDHYKHAIEDAIEEIKTSMNSESEILIPGAWENGYGAGLDFSISVLQKKLDGK